MAHIEDRWYKTVNVDGKPVQVPKPGCGKGMRYRVRYLDPAGQERSASFPDKKKRVAADFLAEMQANILKGTYVDLNAGKITFRSYSAGWLKSVSGDPNREGGLERGLRLHVYPYFGDRPLSAVQPSTIRAWLKALADEDLSVNYQRNLYADTSAIFNSAVDDKLIPSNPFHVKTVRPPRPVATKVKPWSTQQRDAVRESIRDGYRETIDVGSGCGLRQGEIFGLSPDDISEDGRTLHVVRQVKLIGRTAVFAAPKGEKVRDVPLPASVRRRLLARTAIHSAVKVTLPWARLDGPLTTVLLYFTDPAQEALDRHKFNGSVWRPAVRKAGLESSPRNGMHVLRHTYASVLLDAGESIKALSLYLGHANPGFTLRVYTHLLPASEDRTRHAIDQSFGDDGAAEEGTTA